MKSKDMFYEEVRNSSFLKFAGKKTKRFDPNTITLAGLLFALSAGLLFWDGKIVYAVVLVIISGFLDLLDGAIAKTNNKKTKFGGVLDSVCDRYSDAAIIIGIMLGYSLDINALPMIPELLIGTAAIVGSIMVSYSRSKGEELLSENITIGIADRPVRMILIVVGAISGCMNYAILLLAILSHFTVLQRMWFIKRKLKGK